jgi:hypothetical protein
VKRALAPAPPPPAPLERELAEARRRVREKEQRDELERLTAQLAPPVSTARPYRGHAWVAPAREWTGAA